MEYRFGKYPTPTDDRVQKYLSSSALEALGSCREELDVLLLHDAPINKGLQDRFPTGSTRLKELIETLQPRFAFYGHYDNPPEPFRIGRTLCAGLNQREARRIPGRDGAMAVLRTDEWAFEFVSP
jgi:Icc-related predicted phosphoesterase